MAKLDQYHQEIADLAFELAGNDLSEARRAVNTALSQLGRHPKNGGFTFRTVKKWVEAKIKRRAGRAQPTEQQVTPAPEVIITPAMRHDARRHERALQRRVPDNDR